MRLHLAFLAMACALTLAPLPSRGSELCSATNLAACDALIARAETDETKSTFHLTRSLVYAELEKLDLALSDALKATKFNPKNVLAYQIACDVYVKLEDTITAEELCTKAIEIEPSVRSYQYRSGVHFATRNYRKAIADNTQCLQIEPDNYDCLAVRSNAYYLLKLYQLALGDAIRAHKIQPTQFMRGRIAGFEKILREQVAAQSTSPKATAPSPQ